MFYAYDYYGKVAMRFKRASDREDFIFAHPSCDAVNLDDIKDRITGCWKQEYDTPSCVCVEYENPEPINWV